MAEVNVAKTVLVTLELNADEFMVLHAVLGAATVNEVMYKLNWYSTRVEKTLQPLFESLEEVAPQVHAR